MPALWPPRGHAGTLARCKARGHAQSEQGRPFKAFCRNAPQCLAGLAMAGANTTVWHSSKTPGKATQDQGNALFLVGKEKPNHVDLSKGKSVEEMSWKWPFHKILEHTCGSENLKVCSHPHSPQPSLAMLFHLCDTASQGYFLLKTRHWALLCCCDSPLPKAVTRVISSTQDSYTTSNVILWAVIRSCSPRLR